jgi:hypothetical protein
MCPGSQAEKYFIVLWESGSLGVKERGVKKKRRLRVK